MGTMHYFNKDFNQNFNRDFKDSFSQASNKSFRPDHTQVITHTPMRTYFQYNSSELLETVQRRNQPSTTFTKSLAKILNLQLFKKANSWTIVKQSS